MGQAQTAPDYALAQDSLAGVIRCLPPGVFGAGWAIRLGRMVHGCAGSRFCTERSEHAVHMLYM